MFAVCLIKFFSKGKRSGLAEIDSVTGEMRSTRSFDREELDEFSVLVVAYDGGSPPLSATATVYVSITDVNDNAPVFSQTEYRAR